jgi:3-hydroxyacyl-[acyl-carrier-protein] dehydratase
MRDLRSLIDLLPQQYPFRMIDEIIDYKEGESLTAVKNITGNEWVFEGANAGSGTFPETLIMEAVFCQVERRKEPKISTWKDLR